MNLIPKRSHQRGTRANGIARIGKGKKMVLEGNPERHDVVHFYRTLDFQRVRPASFEAAAESGKRKPLDHRTAFHKMR